MANTARHSGAAGNDNDPIQNSGETRPSFYDAIFETQGHEQKKHKPGEASSSHNESEADITKILTQLSNNQQIFMQSISGILQQLAAQNQALLSLQSSRNDQPAPAVLATSSSSEALVNIHALAEATSAAVNVVKNKVSEEAAAAAKAETERKRKAEKITQEEIMETKKFFRPIRDKLQKIVSLRKRVEKERDLILNMENEQFPSGVRPFKCPVELGDLQEHWPNSYAADHDLKITIKQGSTVETVLRTVYHWCQKFTKERLADCWEAKLARDRNEVKKNDMVNFVYDAVKTATEKKTFNLETADESPWHAEALRTYISGIYDKTVQDIQEVEAKKTKEARIKSERELKKQDSLNKSDPAALIVNTITDCVENVLAKHQEVGTWETPSPEDPEEQEEEEDQDMDKDERERKLREQRERHKKLREEREEQKRKNDKTRQAREDDLRAGAKQLAEGIRNDLVAPGGRGGTKGKSSAKSKGKGDSRKGSKGNGKGKKGKGKSKVNDNMETWRSRKPWNTKTSQKATGKAKGNGKGKSKGKGKKGKSNKTKPWTWS
eukprot:TRINITY_DN57117_c0_g1_i1.p1 TRINITY_DN57117_c0_g1~~TRINITY_DN57117_c0_g1_i1.p1  ORF type:complete len:552 (+),score=121.27 TRINITY_DN57117_c0_g1_i1:260-1915(+)